MAIEDENGKNNFEDLFVKENEKNDTIKRLKKTGEIVVVDDLFEDNYKKIKGCKDYLNFFCYVSEFNGRQRDYRRGSLLKTLYNICKMVIKYSDKQYDDIETKIISEKNREQIENVILKYVKVSYATLGYTEYFIGLNNPVNKENIIQLRKLEKGIKEKSKIIKKQYEIKNKNKKEEIEEDNEIEFDM